MEASPTQVYCGELPDSRPFHQLPNFLSLHNVFKVGKQNKYKQNKHSSFQYIYRVMAETTAII